jgi:hypothetical protein
VSGGAGRRGVGQGSADFEPVGQSRGQHVLHLVSLFPLLRQEHADADISLLSVSSSDENDFFLCRSSDFETVCSALSSQGWLREGSLYDESTLESVPHLDLDGPVKIVDLDMVDDDGSASCSSDAWLDAKSSFVNTPREADSLDISLVDIPPASPLPTPPLSQPVHTSAGIKSSLGLVGTQFHLSSPAIKSFIQRWSLGDADDHPFFSIVGDSSLASGSSTGCEKQIKVAVFGNALALEKFVPGSVVEEDLEEAMASLPFALEVKHARHHSVPPSLFASFSQASDGRPASAGGRPGLVHRHSHPPPSSTFVDHWLQALDDSLTRLEEDTAGGRDESGLTRVWGSIEINLLGTDGLHRPGIIHSCVCTSNIADKPMYLPFVVCRKVTRIN